MCTRYRKIVGDSKDIENNFYVNDSPNDNLKSEFLERFIEMLLV